MHLLETNSITVSREGTNSYVDGMAVPAPGAAVDVLCSAQPLSGQERMLLSEGERDKNMINIWSTFQFLTGDIVVFAGDTYRVLRVQPWTVPGTTLQHYHAQAMQEPT